jgi:3-oxoacyl-[acyl-carrier protein] reductase
MSETRRILITGTSRGLGRALAEHYLAAGDVVIGCARGASDLAAPAYTHFPVDITDEHAVADLATCIRQGWGGLDAVINNAGIAAMNPVALMPLDTARRILDTNFTATFLLTRAAIRLLRSSAAGRIVNFTTVAVPLRLEGEAVYAASKSAVETFTRITARELTEAVPEDKMQSLIARQAIRRWAEPSDVANVVDFFLRPESGMITGQVVYLGGIS